MLDFAKHVDRDFLKKNEADFLKANENNELNGNLDMKQHKITSLVDSTETDSAVTKQFVVYRLQGIENANVVTNGRIDKLEETITTLSTDVLKANEDNILNGRLDMNQHRIIGLADPVENDHAVTKRYVSSRVQPLADENAQIRRRIDRFERLHQ